ncbi:MAG: tRNA pseudouridine(38-40) synthase TruA, partial [Clostridia bacterium]|nr:tRNA pseudouridine(38-40) synthase TruA [Clostridia bacterium]
MNRYKLVIEYDGSAFSGFQVQPERRTIQGEIEKVLEFLLKTKTKIYASGRTDAGVSALGQVAHFDTEQELD